MQIWKKIKPYFQFSKNEKRGVIVLLVLIIVSLVVRVSIPFTSFRKVASKIEFGVIEFERKIIKEKEAKSSNVYINREEVKMTEEMIRPANFDPNTSRYSELISVGFPQRIANTIIKFRDNGGLFKSNPDLYKIYGIDSSYQELIENYCKIDPGKIQQIENQRSSYLNKLKIELNGADSAMLTQISGIGQVLSMRIIRYREKLGGFVRKEQLMEIYGIHPENYNSFDSRLTLDTNQIILLNINQASEQELSKHPYLNNYQSRAIIRYRELMGDFTTLQEVLDNFILTKEEFLRVKSYLSVN